MRRDINILRQILELVEANETISPIRISLPDIEQHIVDYHVQLLVEARYACEPATHYGYLSRLTWRGHNALDKLKAGQGIAALLE